MATETLEKKSLVLAFEEGMDTKGNPIIKRYLYSNIDASAPSQNLLDAAQAIAGLYKGNIVAFNTIDTNSLSN